MTLTWLTRWTNSNTWSRQKKCTFLMREISFVFISKTSFFCNYTFCFLVWHMGFKDVVHHPTLTDVTWQKKHKSVELLFFVLFFIMWHNSPLTPEVSAASRLSRKSRTAARESRPSLAVCLWGWIFIIGNRGSSSTHPSFPAFVLLARRNRATSTNVLN